MAFRLINRNPVPVTASVSYREQKFPATGRTLAVRDVEKGKPVRVDDWRPLDRKYVEVRAEESICRLRLTIEPDSMLDVSSMYWMSVTQVMERLEEVEAEHGDLCRIFSLGKTVQGRHLPVIDFSSMGCSDAPLCLVGATPQSHELGTVAVMGILEAILSGRLNDAACRCRPVLLPLSNPDGNALGTCMTNSRRQNVIFGFGEAGTGRAAEECEAVWEYVCGERPAFYLEFHSYPHLNRPSFRPYDFDRALFPDEASRERGEIFFRAVKGASPHPPVFLKANTLSEVSFRPTLISRLIRELGVPATLYKLHNRETVDANRQHAIEVLRSAVQSMCPGK